MRKEAGQTIHPDDAAFVRRRKFLSRSLVATTGVCLAAEVGVLWHINYQDKQSQGKLNEILKAHPKLSEEAIAEATKIIDEQNVHHDLPQRKVLWAQEQFNLKKAFDEEFNREFPHGTVPWLKTDMDVAIGACVLALGSIKAWGIVRDRTRRELSRRDFLRRIAGSSREMER